MSNTNKLFAEMLDIFVLVETYMEIASGRGVESGAYL